MSRRMYSESQLNKMIDSKIEGYDASIPTDLNASGDVLKLEHDTQPLGEGIHFKQLFGNYTIFGEGNIDLYNHWIALVGASDRVCNINIASSKNIICKSIQNLDDLIGSVEKVIPCNGYLLKANDDGTTTPVTILALDWRGTFAKSRFMVSDRTWITTANSGLVRVIDAVEAL